MVEKDFDMMHPSVVQTKSLTKNYGQTVGAADVNLVLSPGEVFGFIGPNGAGKTTIIRLLLGFIRPTSGSARIFGLDVNKSSVEIHAEVGYMPSDLSMYEKMKGEEFLRWLMRLRGRGDLGYMFELADRLSLDLSRKIKNLSSGNKQKVGLVQAFMHKPNLLILDEPTSGLDPLIQREFRKLVHEHKARGVTVFLSSHVLSEVEEICDRVGTIVNGRLINTYSIENLRDLAKRRIEVRFAEKVSEVDLELLHNLENIRDITLRHSRSDKTIATFDISGSIDELIKTLAKFSVEDLAIATLSLEEMFLENYDNGNSSSVDELTQEG